MCFVGDRARRLLAAVLGLEGDELPEDGDLRDRLDRLDLEEPFVADFLVPLADESAVLARRPMVALRVAQPQGSRLRRVSFSACPANRAGQRLRPCAAQPGTRHVAGDAVGANPH